MQGAEPSFVTARDGCRIAVYESGNPGGPACLFLHGFALDHSVWVHQFTDPGLRAGCRLLAVDLRGHGRSCRPGLPEDYASGKTWASDLAAVLEARALVRPVLVAWSFGGRVVNDYLRHYGQAGIAGINYVAAASVSDADVILPDHELLQRLCRDDLYGEDRQRVMEAYIQRSFGLAPGTPEFRRLAAVLAAMPVDTMKYFRERPLDYDALLAGLTVPVLATHGAADAMFAPAMSERLAARVKNGRASVYPDAGHAPFYEQPQRFNRELLEFVSACTEIESDKSPVITDENPDFSDRFKK